MTCADNDAFNPKNDFADFSESQSEFIHPLYNWKKLLENNADDRLKVLVVDDDKVVSSTIADAAESCGAHTTVCTSGAQAIAKIKTEHFDIIFTDLLMPGMNGFELITIVKQLAPHTEVFVVTGYGTLENAVECTRRGAEGFIVKPEILNNVRAVVKKARGKKNQEQNAKMKEPSQHFALNGQAEVAIAKARDRKRLKQLAHTDQLTSLFNRRIFMHFLRQEWERSLRHRTSFALLIIDIDNFKRYNDSNGLLAGDLALVKMAEAITTGIRASDIPARYGGDEFAVILPETERSNALLVAERVRKSISLARITGKNEKTSAKLTASIGIAVYPEDGGSPLDLVDSADNARYKAKKRGKNRIRNFQGKAGSLAGSLTIKE